MDVKEIREKLNFSQQALADILGIPKDRIAKWEQGKGSPKVEDAKKLEQLFKEHFPRGTSMSPPNDVHLVKRLKNIVSDPEAPYGYKDKYIAALERENERLKKDLDLSLGEIRHNVLLSRAIAETNQDLLIEVLVKQRKTTVETVALEVGKANGEKYQKLKEESKFPEVGK